MKSLLSYRPDDHSAQPSIQEAVQVPNLEHLLPNMVSFFDLSCTCVCATQANGASTTKIYPVEFTSVNGLLVFGDCGTLQCAQNNDNFKIHSRNCIFNAECAPF